MGALIPLIAMMAPMIIGAFSKGDSSGGQTTTDPTLTAMLPYMKQMFQSQAARQEASNPLYDAVLRMTMGGLPKWARLGGAGITPAKYGTPDDFGLVPPYGGNRSGTGTGGGYPHVPIEGNPPVPIPRDPNGNPGGPGQGYPWPD